MFWGSKIFTQEVRFRETITVKNKLGIGRSNGETVTIGPWPILKQAVMLGFLSKCFIMDARGQVSVPLHALIIEYWLPLRRYDLI